MKNDANSNGIVWVCNSCRHRPPNQQKINDRNIESANPSKALSTPHPPTDEASNSPSNRPSLIRQTSEHSESKKEENKFRIQQRRNTGQLSPQFSRKRGSNRFVTLFIATNYYILPIVYKLLVISNNSSNFVDFT